MRRALLTPTDAPAQWSLVGALLLGAVAGLLVVLACGWASSSVLSVTAAGAVAAGIVGGAPGRPERLAPLVVVVVLGGVTVAGATSGLPFWAAGAMALVAVLTSALAAAGPIGAALGTLGTLAYAVTASVVLLQGLDASLSEAQIATRTAAGCAAGALVGLGLARGGGVDVPAPWNAMGRSLRRFDTHAHDGVRRAVVLGPAMYLVQDAGSRDALWIFLGALAILLAPAKLAVPNALVRLGGSVVGVVLLGVLALFLPVELLVVAAGLALLPGIAYLRRYPLLAGGLLALSAIVAAGAPSDDLGQWAMHRVWDTLLGCSVALLAQLVLWPRDPPGDVDGDRDPYGAL